MQTAAILGQSSIAQLAVFEDLFDEVKAVFDFGSDAGFVFLRLRFAALWVKFLALAWPHRNMPIDRTIGMLGSLVHSDIPGISPYPFLFAMQQLVGDGHIVFVGGCRGDAV